MRRDTGLSVRGVSAAPQFPRIIRKRDGKVDGEHRHTHVIAEFDRPVIGPVLIGAGRYRGYGLLRPLHEGRSIMTKIAELPALKAEQFDEFFKDVHGYSTFPWQSSCQPAVTGMAAGPT